VSVEYIHGLFAEHRHGCILFDRMARLEGAGFRAALRGDFRRIRFVHPSKTVPSVALLVHGRVTDLDDRPRPQSERIDIQPEDDETLARWLADITPPTFWQRFFGRFS